MTEDSSVVRLGVAGQEAIADHLRRGVPCILERAAADWPALTRWTAEWLAAEFGQQPVGYRISPSRAHPHFTPGLDGTSSEVGTTPLRDYLARVQGDPTIFLDANLVCLASRRGQVHAGLAPLLDDTRPLPQVPADQVDTVGLWISGHGVRTRLHYDRNGRHNINVQVSGSKDFVLVHPEQVNRLEPLPMTSPVYNFCGLDTGSDDLLDTLRGRGIRYLAGSLSAGDVLFLPAFWYHAFEHRGSFNVNVNYWVDASNVVIGPAVLRNEVATLLQAANRDTRLAASIPDGWQQFVARVERHALAWTPARAAVDEQASDDR